MQCSSCNKTSFIYRHLSATCLPISVYFLCKHRNDLVQTTLIHNNCYEQAMDQTGCGARVRDEEKNNEAWAGEWVNITNMQISLKFQVKENVESVTHIRAPFTKHVSSCDLSPGCGLPPGLSAGSCCYCWVGSTQWRGASSPQRLVLWCTADVWHNWAAARAATGAGHAQ